MYTDRFRMKCAVASPSTVRRSLPCASWYDSDRIAFIAPTSSAWAAASSADSAARTRSSGASGFALHAQTSAQAARTRNGERMPR